MSSRLTNISLLKAAVVAVTLPLVASASYAQAASGPFADLEGAWSGTGTISMSNGTNERIRCRASYLVTESGRLLSQDLRCASDSYKFELQTTVAHQGGTISGTWNETTRSVVGSISGRISGNTIQAPGSEVSEVSITLRRGTR